MRFTPHKLIFLFKRKAFTIYDPRRKCSPGPPVNIKVSLTDQHDQIQQHPAPRRVGRSSPLIARDGQRRPSAVSKCILAGCKRFVLAGSAIHFLVKRLEASCLERSYRVDSELRRGCREREGGDRQAPDLRSSLHALFRVRSGASSALQRLCWLAWRLDSDSLER